MRLVGNDGSYFELKILGYQYTGAIKSAYDEYDANWLSIQINVKTPKGSWNATDPCLLTDEVKALAEWLMKIYINHSWPNTYGTEAMSLD